MGSEKRKVKQTENVLNCKFVDASCEEKDTEREDREARKQ